MPFIITSIHDPVALSTTCQRLNMPEPEEGCMQLEAQEAAGWIIRLSGVRYPIVCDTLTGLVAYHPTDNAFRRYGRIMSFVYRFYDVRHRLRQRHSSRDVSKPVARKDRHFTLAGVGC